MQELTMTPATVVFLIQRAACAVWAVCRLCFRGLCDCHGDKKSKKGESGCSTCSACHGCSTCNISIPESPEQK